MGGMWGGGAMEGGGGMGGGGGGGRRKNGRGKNGQNKKGRRNRNRAPPPFSTLLLGMRLPRKSTIFEDFLINSSPPLLFIFHIELLHPSILFLLAIWTQFDYCSFPFFPLSRMLPRILFVPSKQY
jgi:hypothetical protein